jgi:hypothetical protein
MLWVGAGVRVATTRAPRKGFANLSDMATSTSGYPCDTLSQQQCNTSVRAPSGLVVAISKQMLFVLC